MKTLLIAAMLPGLLWKQDPARLNELKNAGIEHIYTSDDRLTGYVKVPPPTSRMQMSEASATTVPWVDSNGWRFLRGLKKALYSNVPAGTAPLAMAEGYAYGADAVIEPAPEDLDAVASMSQFLKRIDAPRLPVLANIGVVDDGSPELGEVMNLLSRRNLLSRVVKTEDPSLDLNIRVGTKQYPREAIRNPNDFAARVREKLSDEKRLLRVYGSDTVLGHLTGDGKHARLHLLNYGKRPAKDVRVRLLGVYGTVHLADSTDPAARATDVTVHEGGTEFTIPSLKTYAVVDLEKKH